MLKLLSFIEKYFLIAYYFKNINNNWDVNVIGLDPLQHFNNIRWNFIIPVAVLLMLVFLTFVCILLDNGYLSRLTVFLLQPILFKESSCCVPRHTTFRQPLLHLKPRGSYLWPSNRSAC